MYTLADSDPGLGEGVDSIPEELSAFWPSRIQHDRTWYRRYVNADERFYTPNQYSDDPPHVYRITDIENNGDTFTLEPCAVTTPNGEQSEPVTGTHYVDTVCDLAGAIELGELVHLPTETLQTVDETTFISAGDTTILISASVDDPKKILYNVDPPNARTRKTQTEIADVLETGDPDTVLYVPKSEIEKPVTAYHSVQPFSRFTFNDDTIKNWCEKHLEPGDRVLNACCGITKIDHDAEVIRNDTREDVTLDRPRTINGTDYEKGATINTEADYHLDAAELAAHLEKESFDVIIFDPPWSIYQSNLRYSGNHVYKNPDDGLPANIDLSILPFETPDPTEKSQLGHARLCKENFHWLLKPHGKVIQLTFHGTTLPARLAYQQEERVIFDPVGEAKSVIGSMDRKTEASTEQKLISTSTNTGQAGKSLQQTLTGFQ